MTTGGVGLVAVMALALGPTVAPTQAAGKPVILSPRSGRVIGAHPIRVRVRAGRHARLFRAQLNGHPIAMYFSRPSRRGVRRLQVSASYGLRYGKNHLHVRVHRAHGRKRSEWSRFRIRRNRPLAAAGKDFKVAAGDKVYLNGGRSRSQLSAAGLPHKGTGSRVRPGVRHDWDVIHAPKGAPPGAALRGAGSSTPVLKTTAPGRYRVKLTVKARNGRTGTDKVGIDADPPPAVHVNTMVLRGGSNVSGIQVGDAFYRVENHTSLDSSHIWAQLVALDRKTLQPVTGPFADLGNKTYTCLRPASGDCGSSSGLTADLARLGSDQLAIVASPTGNCVIGEYEAGSGLGLESALSRIGVSETGFDANAEHFSCHGQGGISAIGVPGTPSGQGDWRSDPSLEGGGRMQGWLMRNNSKYYAFTSSDRIQYDTQASGSNNLTAVIKVGDQVFKNATNGARGGFQVVVADPQTLQGDSRWFDTGVGDQRDGQLVDMNAFLRDANGAGDKLIIVASRGIPAVTNGAGPGFNQDDLNYNKAAIVDSLERAGATRTAAFRALDRGMSKDTSYTLIGYSGAGGGNGIEGVVDHTPAPGSTAMSVAPITGTMARTGPNYGFEPQAAPLVGEQAMGSTQHDTRTAAAQLNDVLVQPASPWPEEDPAVFPDAAERARKQAAIKWIGQQIFNTDDFRGQYYTKIFPDTRWSEIAVAVQRLTYQGTNDFTAADLAWAQNELAGRRKALEGGEIGWLINANDYMEKVSKPFSESQLTQWSDFAEIESKIQKEVGVEDEKLVKAEQQAVFDIGRGVISFISPQAGAGQTLYGFAELLSIDQKGTPASEPFTVKALNLGSELTKRLTDQQKWIAQKIPDVVTADYQKLKAVGSCASDTADGWATCPFDHNDWQFTQDDADAAAAALLPRMRTWAYGTLLHAKFNLYKLPPWWQTDVAHPDQFFGVTADGVHEPFKNEPLSATVAKPIYRNAPDYGHTIRCPNLIGPCESHGDTWQIFALGYLTGSGGLTDRWVMHYPSGPDNQPLTDVIFKPASDGGLGADPESFYDRFWPETSTLDHYPEEKTLTGWCINRDTADCQ